MKIIVKGETRKAAKVLRKKTGMPSGLLYLGFRLSNAMSTSLGVK